MNVLKQLIDEGHRFGMNAERDFFDHETFVNKSLQEDFLIWTRKVLHYLENKHPNSSDTKEVGDRLAKDCQECHIETYKLIISILESLVDIDSVAEGIDYDLLTRVLNRFSSFIKQLNRRHNNRKGIDVKDEYDVQNLLHALLITFYDDVRAEDPVPICAGGSSRLDFFISDINTAIEVKMTRRGLGDKTLGDQLLNDVGRYATRNDIDRLVFFVYDPGGHIHNPVGMKNDIEQFSKSDFEIRVIIIG